MRLPRFKISHHQHSGRLRPHEDTSYFFLGVLLLVVGAALTVCSVSALGPHPGPQAGSIGLTGTMPGAAPTVAATILSPANGQRFTSSPITVTGTCPKNTLVEIYKSDIFAGSTICDNSGNFSLQIDLLIGPNSLIARVYDALNQPGPDSAAVAISYDALPAQASSILPLNLGGSQLLLNTSAVYRGTFPGQELSIPITVIGGSPPYAVNVEWGDTHNKVVPRDNNLAFNVSHAYTKPGTYQITLQATDAQMRTAFLTVAAIVNGQPAITLGSTNPQSTQNRLLVLWPLYTSAAAVVVSFWLGERREKYVLSHIPMRPHPQV
jgi:hypothetical protein